MPELLATSAFLQGGASSLVGSASASEPQDSLWNDIVPNIDDFFAKAGKASKHRQ